MFKWVHRAGVAALTLVLGAQAWEQVAPDKPQVNSSRQQVAAELLPQVVEDLRASRGELRSAALVQLQNDVTGYVTDQLRQAIDDSGALSLKQRTIAEKTRSKLGFAQPEFPDAAAAIERGRELAAEAVVFGVVRDFESLPTGARIDLELKLADVSSGALLLERRYTRDTTSPAGETDEPAAATAQPLPPAWILAKRIVVCLLVTLLLPVFTIGFLRAVVRQRSNGANAATLGIYTASVGLLAYLLIGGFSTGLTAAVVGSAVLLAFAYNVWMMSYALRLELD